jgi:cytochrome c oxidase subunit 2
VGKLWSLLFLLVPVLGVGLFLWAPSNGYWLPRDISKHGWQIDHLFNFILVLTGLVFVATEGLLFWFLWRYDAKTSSTPVKYTHGSHNLEVIWTILPAATLLFIAIYQMNAWADVKMRKPKDMPPTVEVTARQFEWRLRYPGPDGKLGTIDDIHHVNDLHIPVDEEVLVELKSMDVLHDFFLPNLRIKQDAVPGMTIPVWFRATDVGTYDLVCAELCGWGHYKMKGRLTIESRAQFDQWLAKMGEAEQATQEPAEEESEDSE